MTTEDPLPRTQRSKLLAFVLVSAGALWLLAATGFIPASFLRALAHLWPLLALGAGLDVLEARRPLPWLPYSLIALLVIAVASAFYGAPAEAPQPEQTTVEVPLATANRAEVAITTDIVALLVRGGASEGALLAGTAVGGAELELTERGRSVRRLDIVAEAAERGPRTQRPSVDAPVGSVTGQAGTAADIRLTDRIPIELDLRAGSGPVTVDLSGLDIAGFAFTGSTGPAAITLGAAGPERYDARLTGGAGSIDLSIPPQSRLNARLEPGVGGAAVSVGARSDLTLILRGGAGPVAIALPEDARIRVAIEDPGEGIVVLSDRLQRVRGAAEGEEEDVYETAGYREVIPTIDIRVEETGAGPISIR